MKLKLWSIQDESRLDEIKSNGKLICTQNKYSEDWDKEYRWMTKHMKKRIGNPELKTQYPIWAWYQYQNKNARRPDLRRRAHLPSGTKGIRIEFEKNENEVLLSDFILWHFPLSYKSLIASTEKEDKEFQSKLKRLKLDKINFSKYPKKIKEEIENSWLKIFDMEFEEKYATYRNDEKMIQACCWEISEEEIVKIDKFKAR